jgi:hypothetical protein
MKRLLITLILFSSINFNLISQSNDIDQLNDQMKSFRGRMKIYFKCLRGKCSKQERNAIEKTVQEDAILILTTLILGGIAGGGSYWLYRLKQEERQLNRKLGVIVPLEKKVEKDVKELKDITSKMHTFEF